MAAGDGAMTAFSISRNWYREHRAGSAMLTGKSAVQSSPCSRRSSAGTVSGRRKARAVSRASPITDKASARLGVTLISSTSPSSDRASARRSPTGALAGRTRMPLWSSLSPSSRSEQIMPWEGAPRSFAFLITSPPGMAVPTRATGTFCPAATLGAPHTMSSVPPCPVSTLQTESLSASGCRPHSTTCPTRTSFKSAKGCRMSSTSRPSMVSLSLMVCAVASQGVNSRSHFVLTSIAVTCSVNLP